MQQYIENVRLNANQIKWIALVCMTLDHALPILEKLSFPSPLILFVNIMGRAAAPLFLFLLTESVRYTKSKPLFVLRLYLAGLLTGIFTLSMNCIFGSIMLYDTRNIMFTFFYTALYIWLLDSIANAVTAKKISNTIKPIFALLISIFIQRPFYWLQTSFPYTDLHITSFEGQHLAYDLIHSTFPSILLAEYSLLFIIMGIAFYFIRKRNRLAIVFLTFCTLSYIGSQYLLSSPADLWPCNEFFQDGQYYMISALPFILAYNGQRGRPHKAFFYIYYPTHRYALSLLGCLL